MNGLSLTADRKEMPNPENPENHENPENPKDSENPKNPESPVNPEDPEDSENPENPEDPENLMVGLLLVLLFVRVAFRTHMLPFEFDGHLSGGGAWDRNYGAECKSCAVHVRFFSSVC